MGAVFWVKRFLLAAVPMFGILAAVEWFKGTTGTNDILSALIWSLSAAAIFTFSAYRRYKAGLACAACDSAPVQRKR